MSVVKSDDYEKVIGYHNRRMRLTFHLCLSSLHYCDKTPFFVMGNIITLAYTAL